MLLQNKNAVIYGAGGSLGSAVARALAASGARVFLTARDEKKIRHIADEIIAGGGRADVSIVDAVDSQAVNTHIKSLVEIAGNVDISFNAIGWKDTQDIPLVEMTPDDFMRPINIAMQTQFITATAAARVMKNQRSGVILSLTATPGGIGYPNVGGFGPACCAVESFSRNLASEVGAYGVRAVNIRSGGSPDSKVFKDAIEAGGEGIDAALSRLKSDTMLKQLPLMQDIANAAVFLASDMAGKITGVTIDVTAGTTSALNHSVATIPFGKSVQK
jgi:NAD(P)-dependent dehydrogenase (short-subunit alcohol dehydrogenase family)